MPMWKHGSGHSHSPIPIPPSHPLLTPSLRTLTVDRAIIQHIIRRERDGTTRMSSIKIPHSTPTPNHNPFEGARRQAGREGICCRAQPIKQSPFEDLFSKSRFHPFGQIANEMRMEGGYCDALWKWNCFKNDSDLLVWKIGKCDMLLRIFVGQYRSGLYGVLWVPWIRGKQIAFFCLQQAGKRNFSSSWSRKVQGGFISIARWTQG